MSVAGADASTTWFDNRLKQLADLQRIGDPAQAQAVGATVTRDLNQLDLNQSQLGLNAATARSSALSEQDRLALQQATAQANLGVQQGQLGLDAARINASTQINANTLAGQSLASVGAGVTSATGGNWWASLPPSVKDWALKNGMQAPVFG
jgi:hypothetical protein